MIEIETTGFNRYDTFKGAEWANKELDITLGGGGSIGSWLALFTSRTGNHNFLVYEFDTFEEKNRGGQFVSRRYVNVKKTEALKRQLKDYSGFKDFMELGKLTEKNNLVSPICLSGFDNPEARELMFESWRQLPDREIFIDGSK
jgi:tRNA A37 threonylcarbamoyladenosine dehydratase